MWASSAVFFSHSAYQRRRLLFHFIHPFVQLSEVGDQQGAITVGTQPNLIHIGQVVDERD